MDTIRGRSNKVEVRREGFGGPNDLVGQGCNANDKVGQSPRNGPKGRFRSSLRSSYLDLELGSLTLIDCYVLRALSN